jgi:hypothetical protein
LRVGLLCLVAGAAFVLAVAGTSGRPATAAGGARLTLPPPVYTADSYTGALAAAGNRAVVGLVCTVAVLDFSSAARPVRVGANGGCSSDPEDAVVEGVWIGRSGLTVAVDDSPSPHGDDYTVTTGPLPAGPLRQVGEYSVRDDNGPDQAAAGCAWTVAAGGGLVVRAPVPNRLGIEWGLDTAPACAAGAVTRLTLDGAGSAVLAIPGSWAVLATDGKRIVLAALSPAGLATGRVELVDLEGKVLRSLSEPVSALGEGSLADAGYPQAWLTPGGLVLSTRTGLVGPGWKVTTPVRSPEATVGEGRLFYLVHRTLYVTRLDTGKPKPLLVVPYGSVSIAAGSFGLAIAVYNQDRQPSVSLYRVPWRDVDRVMTSG